MATGSTSIQPTTASQSSMTVKPKPGVDQPEPVTAKPESDTTDVRGSEMDRNDDIAALATAIDKEKPFFWHPAPEPPLPLTSEMIAAAEKKLGFRLPTAYLAILKLQNGGYPRYDAYGSHSEGNHTYLVGIAGIGNEAAAGNIEDSPRTINIFDERWGTHHAQSCVLLCEDYHWWIGLDYSKCGPQGEPCVIHFEDEGAEDVEDTLTVIAPDFRTFLFGLYNQDPFYAYGFVGVGQNPTPLIEQLEQRLGVEFSRPADILSPQGRQVAATHPRWHDWSGMRPPAKMWLVKNTQNEALAFPAHPECDWVLQSTIHRSFQSELEAELQAVTHEVVPLHIPPWDKLEW